MNRKARLIAVAVTLGIVAVFALTGADNYDGINPKLVRKDPGTGHIDTTWVTASSSDDTLTFGFGARTVSVCTKSGSRVRCQILGAADLLRSGGGGSVTNPRVGLARVSSQLWELQGAECKLYDNTDKLFYGVRLVNVDADSVLIEADS